MFKLKVGDHVLKLNLTILCIQDLKFMFHIISYMRMGLKFMITVCTDHDQCLN